MNRMIRLLDVVLSLVGIAMMICILPIVWLVQRFDSRGPLFYRADRVGLNMRPFKMYKLRSMVDLPVPIGECLSPQYDPRVTPFGRFLRRTKLNELPQVLNILKGEMSFVGPRPESPELAELYPDYARIVFTVKPGLVGPASIHGRNEEESYSPGVDLKQFYIENLLPAKVQLDLGFIRNPGWLNYFKYLFLGMTATMAGISNRRLITANQPQIYLLIADLVCITSAYLLAYNLCVWHLMGSLDFVHSTRLLPIVIVIRLLCNQYFGLYRPLLELLSSYDILNALKSNVCGTAILLLLCYLLERNSYSVLLSVFDLAGVSTLSVAVRWSLMLYYRKKWRAYPSRKKSRVMIFGACEDGLHAYRSMMAGLKTDCEVVGFIDDDSRKIGKTLSGKKVLGNRYHIREVARLYRIEEMIICAPQIQRLDLMEILDLCCKGNLKCSVFSRINPFDELKATVPLRLSVRGGDIPN